MTGAHLTDEQFCDLLAGDSAPASATEHLEACEACQLELAETKAAVENLNRGSFAWAETRAVRQIRTPSRWKMRREAMSAWSLPLVTALVLILVGTSHDLFIPRRAQHPLSSMAARVSSQAMNSEIAEDNRLLLSIDQELDYRPHTSVPFEQWHKKKGSATRRVLN